ncbi:MEDS domain-containing protein [Mesobacillus sp.]|uniref:MEDS domain-containing protein n=1 Tax=Mesobacillus sp. TaxID=2675271 RepID=UPI0039EE859B
MSTIQRGANLECVHLKEVNEIASLAKGHGIYFFQDQDRYISNVVDFVISGLERNEYSIIVENDRIIPLIQKRLTDLLDESRLEKVKFINNYDFYYDKGDFSINSIFDFLPNLIEGYSENLTVRSWAHVEWRDEPEVSKKLMGSEKEADVIVNQTNLLSVCAYDSERVSEELKQSLLTCHNLLINEKENGV